MTGVHGIRSAVAALSALALGSGPAPAPAQAPDVTPPTVTVLSPATGEVVSGELDFQVRVLDDDGGSGTDEVRFLIDNVPIAVDHDPADGFDLKLDSRYLADGEHQLHVSVRDAAGNQALGAAVGFLVDNRASRLTKIRSPEERELAPSPAPPDTTAPVGRVLAPVPGEAVRGTFHLRAWAADDSAGSGLDRVEFLIDGAVVGQGALAADLWSYAWNAGAADGAHQVQVRAHDRAGHVSTSAAVPFVVDSAAPVLSTAANLPSHVEPAEINVGQVLVLLYFDGTGSDMDPRVVPTVTYQAAAPPGGGPRPAPVPVIGVVYTGDRYLARVAIGAGVNAGQADVAVEGARDRAGNTLAPVASAAQFQVVRHVAWPLAATGTTHDIWHMFGDPIRWSTGTWAPNYFHEGLDLNTPVGTIVRAAEAGSVARVDPDPGPGAHGTGTGYYNMITVNTALPGRAFRYMHFVYINNPTTGAAWTTGDAVAAGDPLGTVVSTLALPGGGAAVNMMLPHTHVEILDAAAPATGWASWTARGDPLRLLQPPTDTTRPIVSAGFAYRYAEHQSAAATTYFPTPGAGHVTINGNVDFVARARDEFGAFARDHCPHRVAWELEDRYERNVVPFTILENMDNVYFDHSRNYGSQRSGARARVVYEFSPGHQTTGGTLNYSVTAGFSTSNDDAVCWYTLTNRDDDDRLETTDANRYFNSDLRQGPGRSWFTQDAPGVADARINREARFPDDHGYRLTVRAYDEAGNENRDNPGPAGPALGRTEVFDLDNFVPFVEEAEVRQGEGRRGARYRARWTLGAGAALTLEPAAPDDRNPRWVNGSAPGRFVFRFSEAMATRTLQVQGQAGGSQNLPLTVVAGGEERIWEAAVTAERLRQHDLDGDAVVLRLEGQDSGGHVLDSAPASPGNRNAARTWQNTDPGSDTQHRIKIDTLHAGPPVPERERLPP